MKSKPHIRRFTQDQWIITVGWGLMREQFIEKSLARAMAMAPIYQMSWLAQEGARLAHV